MCVLAEEYDSIFFFFFAAFGLKLSRNIFLSREWTRALEAQARQSTVPPLRSEDFFVRPFN